MSQVVRTTREYFLSDQELKRTLGLEPASIILQVVRKSGTLKGHRGRDEPIDLYGCLITVYVPEEDPP